MIGGENGAGGAAKHLSHGPGTGQCAEQLTVSEITSQIINAHFCFPGWVFAFFL